MKSGIKGVSAALRAAVALEQIYHGSPITITALSETSGLSVSYLEQIFSRFRRAGIVRSVRGPGGGYHLEKTDLTVSDIIRAVSGGNAAFLEPVFVALDSVKISAMGVTA